MLIESDNTAADLCIRYAGGTKKINQFLEENKIEGMSVDRPTYVALSNYLGIMNVTENEAYDDAKIVQELRNLTREQREQAAAKFMQDQRDNSSPMAMVKLLQRTWDQEILSKASTDLFLQILKECKTGDNRLKGLLPAGTIVYHKTGTIGSVSNDVGIIALPEPFGNIAIAVFIKEAQMDSKETESIIANVARTLYDIFIANHQ